MKKEAKQNKKIIYSEIRACRMCGNSNLQSVITLGSLALSGVFPLVGEEVAFGPLELVKCYSDNGKKVCGLLQLKHNYDLNTLYGDNYGYRSGLNQSMVDHLKSIVKKVTKVTTLKKNELVIDIGSNDGTLLKAYPADLDLVGIDPTIKKFDKYYPSHITRIPSFFSSSVVQEKLKQKVKVITSIAMLYDLEYPVEFAKQIVDVLDDDGIWVTEQSYMPKMFENMAYDTICHEHLEYYTLSNLKWMADKIGLKIIDVEINDINGSSFCVVFAKKNSPFKAITKLVESILKREETFQMDKLDFYMDFSGKIKQANVELLQLLVDINKKGKKIFGYGASTKGSVILQTSGIGKKHISYIAEVNEYKFGRLAPGTDIPIISEIEARNMKPDYFLVLPWHFRENIIQREQAFLASGGKLVFPLPRLEIIES